MEAENNKLKASSEKNQGNFEEMERENEKKLLNLIAKVIVEITLKEFYETGDQVPEI